VFLGSHLFLHNSHQKSGRQKITFFEPHFQQASEWSGNERIFDSFSLFGGNLPSFPPPLFGLVWFGLF
jgi:hypothetical protein